MNGKSGASAMSPSEIKQDLDTKRGRWTLMLKTDIRFRLRTEQDCHKFKHSGKRKRWKDKTLE
eukprot:227946-Amphidinium_carterae.1